MGSDSSPHCRCWNKQILKHVGGKQQSGTKSEFVPHCKKIFMVVWMSVGNSRFFPKDIFGREPQLAFIVLKHKHDLFANMSQPNLHVSFLAISIWSIVGVYQNIAMCDVALYCWLVTCMGGGSCMEALPICSFYLHVVIWLWYAWIICISGSYCCTSSWLVWALEHLKYWVMEHTAGQIWGEHAEDSDISIHNIHLSIQKYLCTRVLQ